MTTKIKIKGSSTTTPTNLEHREPSVSFTDGRCKLLIGNVFGDAIELTDGANIKNTPAGNIASITMQNAINELDSEKLAKSSNLSDVANRQIALNSLTDIENTTNEYVLTKDTATGNAIFKPSVGGGSASTIATTATTGGTTTLTASSANIQRFTGTAGQILVLPDATTLTNAKSFDILNDCTTATGAISIRTNGGAYLTLVPQTGKATIILEDNGTTAGVWSVEVSVPNISGLTIINSTNSFTAGQYLTNGVSTYVLSKADSRATLPCIARVVSANANQYAIFTSGICSANLGLDSGLTANTSYIISNITAGAVIAYPATPSDGQLIQPVFEASSATSGVFNPLTVSTWNVSANSATSTTQGTVFLANPITIANNATDANNDIDFSAGNAPLDDGLGQVLLSSTLVKRLDASWVAGTNQGGLFSGTKANSTRYYLFAITNGTINDAGFDISPTGANIPAGYKGSYRGMILTNSSGNILAFDQLENNYFEFITPILEVSGTTPTTRTPLPVSAPQNVIVKINATLSSVAPAGSVSHLYLTDLNKTDNSVIKLFANISFISSGEFTVKTNSSSQIGIRGNGSSGSYEIYTIGFFDTNIKN